MRKYFFRLLIAAITMAAATGPTVGALASEDFRLIYFPHEDTDSVFSNDWGDSRSGGRGHQGTDILAEKHSAVVAVADGFITAMDKSPRSGFYVRIAHQDGWESWYMHLNNDSLGTDDGVGGSGGAFPPGLEIGAFVLAGTVIGYVGDSGNAEGGSSHTHFELHNGRSGVNPYPYLNAAYDRWVRVMDLSDQLR
ncbi:MAG: M23 family metallopeptidase [Actinomycetota bacterium]|nr:M23 family metallopeptidase [Actinomycetota bacterium]